MFIPIRLDLGRVATQGETVTDDGTVHEGEMRLGPETEGRNALVGVVVEEDAGDCVDGDLVLVGLVGVHVVEGGWVHGHAVGTGEVDGDGQV